jgi:aspartyl-tRNA(Asn)/glutamyl-tRNA(Gln) amidotransferase subunit A
MTPTIPEASRALRSGEITSRRLTEASLSAAEELAAALAALVLIDRPGALEAADRADEAIASGRDLGPLMGIPVAVKDIVDMEGHATRCGSPAYPTTPVSTDATLTERLRAGGAVIIGKTTAHELACGVSSAPASNPWDRDRVPGGSSGGSGAAVAARIVPMAIGSDTGGSIRIPAALCGVVGLKPTYGRVSRAGVEPLSWSLDHLGPLAATVEGCAATLQVIAGADPRDPSASDMPVPDFGANLASGVDGLRLGVLSGAPVDPMQPAVAEAFAVAADRLAEAGAVLVSVTIPELEHTLAAEFGIVGPEAAAYHRERLRRDPALIDPGIRALLVAGLMLPAEQYFRALEARRILSEAIRRAFAEHRLDALLTPTLPATAAHKDQEEIDYGTVAEPVTLSYVRTTAPCNLAGLPALSVPAGLDGDGLPIGLQIATPAFAESTALRIGAAFEALTDWGSLVPPTASERIAS